MKPCLLVPGTLYGPPVHVRAVAVPVPQSPAEPRREEEIEVETRRSSGMGARPRFQLRSQPLRVSPVLTARRASSMSEALRSVNTSKKPRLIARELPHTSDQLIRQRLELRPVWSAGSM